MIGETAHNHSFLTREQEIELGRRVQAGDPDARNELAEHNLRLVYSIARKYHTNDPASTFEDLVQEGMVGLTRAINKYDPERGFRFTTYAVWWIRQAVRRYCITAGTIARPPHTPKELKTSEYRDALVQAYLPVASLDTPLTNDSDNTLLDILAAHESSVEDETLNRIEVERLLSRLAPHHQQIVLAWMNGATLAEAGQMAGRSRELARQVLLNLRKKVKG